MSPEQNNGNDVNNLLESNTSSFNGQQNMYGQLSTSDKYKDGFKSLAAAFEDAGSILDPNRAPAATTPPTDTIVEQKTFIDKPPEIPPKPVFGGYNAPAVFQSPPPMPIPVNTAPTVMPVQETPVEQNLGPAPIEQAPVAQEMPVVMNPIEQNFEPVLEATDFNNTPVIQEAPIEHPQEILPTPEMANTEPTPDYFNHSFGEEHSTVADGILRATEVPQEQLESFDIPVAESLPVQDDLFNYESNIQTPQSGEMTQIFMPSNEPPVPIEPPPSIEKKPAIEFDEEGGADFRAKKTLIKLTLFSFYVMIIGCAAYFGYMWYDLNSSFTLGRDEITLANGSSYQVEVILKSRFEDNNRYTWKSADESIATVDSDGIVTAVGSGTTKITIKSKKTGKTKELSVKALSILVEDIRFEKSKINMNVGDEVALSPIINNDESIIINLLWDTSDPNVATVDDYGRVTAVGAGTTTIIAIEEQSNLAAEIQVIVTAKKETSNTNTNVKPPNVSVTSIVLSRNSANIKIDDTITVTATVLPANATNKGISWSSSNNSIATVSNGRITGIAEGTAVITATTRDGNKTASITITVTKGGSTVVPVTGISITNCPGSLEVGKNATLNYAITPENATNKNVSWSSDDASIVSVNNGVVQAHKEGTATITVTTADGGKTARCEIRVSSAYVPATGVSLNETALSLDIGGTFKLNATVVPGNATEKNLHWSSRDTSIATVDSSGNVTAIGAGSTTITVTVNGNNNIRARCTVTVTDPDDN